MVQGFYLRFYYVGMMDEVIGHMIEFHLQSLLAPWRVGVRWKFQPSNKVVGSGHQPHPKAVQAPPSDSAH